MNDFESRLQELLRSTGQRDPTPEWKDDILATALAQASNHQSRGLPRSLVTALGIVWALILIFRVLDTEPAAPRPAPSAAPLLFAAHHQQVNELLQ